MAFAQKFTIFGEINIFRMFEYQINQMKDEIANKSENYILNVNENEFVSWLVEKYSFENLEIHFDKMFVTDYEKECRAEEFPKFIDIQPGHTYKKFVFTFHLPFIGKPEALKFDTTPFLYRKFDVYIENCCICFDTINFSDDQENISREKREMISYFRGRLFEVNKQINEFNSSLSQKALENLQKRKGDFLKKNNLLASLDIPIKKRGDFPETFAIPTPNTQKKIRIKQPQVTEKGYKPEPTLDVEVYQDILQIIQDVGKQFERMPSTYSDKDEESLRDHILFVLEPHFSGSATGETFNKKGKTDILLRYENSNVFIAECKFWEGKKGYFETIDQLLGYLTWRDSKSAIVMFVKNKDFSSVVQTVELQTPNHKNYLGFSGKRDETWLNYRFHINDDDNREVKLAVLLFHIPPM